MNAPVEFKKIREFGELIGDTFLFIKQNFKPLLKAYVYLSGIFILGAMLSALITQLQLVDITAQTGVPISNNPFEKIAAIGFNYIIVVIFVMLSYTAMYVTILSYVALYVQKGNIAPNVEEVWAYFKYYFFRLFGSGLLMSIFLGLCFVCCLVPGIYVFPMATLFYPVMILENGNFSHAFERSFKLIKNEWWVTAATILISYLIFYAFSMVVQLPAIIIMMVNAFTHAAQPISKSYAIVAAISQYISYVFLIIPIITSTLCYFNLVERKESLGLLNRIDSLGQAAPSDLTDQEEY